MVKSTTLSKFQESMQAERDSDTLASRPVESTLSDTPPSPLAQLAERMVRERSTEAPTDDEITAQMQGLGLIDEIDAHMALGEIKSRVWSAADAASIPATAEQIDAEAERIWTFYGDTRRASEASYSVGPDGLVDGYERTERPAEAPVKPKAVEMPEMPQKPLEVIKDSEFGGDDEYFVSGALANRARVLISRHPEHLDHLRRLSVTYLWKRQGGKSKGRATFGKCSKPSGLLKHFSEANFVIWLAADHCRAAGYTDREIEALLLHEMLHTSVEEPDENTGRGGGPALRPHDFEGFVAEIEIYGPITPELRSAHDGFEEHRQISMFDMPTGGTPPGPKARPEADRFWAKVNKNGPIPESRPDLGACWLWTGATNNRGYSRFKVGSNVDGSAGEILGHVWSFRDSMQEIPAGYELDHLCRTRECVRASHLEAVTHRENTLRGNTVAAANAAKTHCPQGHSYDGDNLHLRPDGSRRCRTCVDAQNKARHAEPKADDPLVCSVCKLPVWEHELTAEEIATMRANPSVVLCEACGEDGILDDGLDGEAAG